MAEFSLREASGIAPELPGGLNIEGLAAGPEGTLWIDSGVRFPVAAPCSPSFGIPWSSPQGIRPNGDPRVVWISGQGHSGSGVDRTRIFRAGGNSGEGGRTRFIAGPDRELNRRR